MKKSLIVFVAALLSLTGKGFAGNVLTVGNVTVAQGGKATLEISGEFDTQYTAFEIELALADGLTLEVDEEDGKPIVAKGFASDHALSGNSLSNGNWKFTCYSMTNASLPTSGVLMRLTVMASDDAVIGSYLDCGIATAEFTRLADSEGENLDAVNFHVSITDSWVRLDENAATAPEASDGEVDIKVTRNITANAWSTICLPFSMTEAQLKAAFGDDVQLAAFTDYEAEYDADDNVTSIVVNFENIDIVSEGLYANYPYLIKTSSDITEFTATSIIEPDEEAAVAEYDNGKSGRQRKVYGSFIGTYHAGTAVPAESLFLSGNQFFYSVGRTEMKAYRAYFKFNDVLSSYNSGAQQAPAAIRFRDNTTSIATVKQNTRNREGMYNLQGQKVKKGHKGIYILNGRKVVVK